MVSLEGFLNQQHGDPPRMTQGQKDLVAKGVRAALDASLPPRVATGILEAIQHALDALPASRACHCCDFFCESSAHCRVWAEAVPPHVHPVGCDRFQNEGVPF